MWKARDFEISQNLSAILWMLGFPAFWSTRVGFPTTTKNSFTLHQSGQGTVTPCKAYRKLIVQKDRFLQLELFYSVNRPANINHAMHRQIPYTLYSTCSRWSLSISEALTDRHYLQYHSTRCNLKRQCHEIFDLYFFSWIESIWAPDNQAKMVLLKNSFLRRYSNLKFKKFDSAQCDTAQSRNFLSS